MTRRPWDSPALLDLDSDQRGEELGAIGPNSRERDVGFPGQPLRRVAGSPDDAREAIEEFRRGPRNSPNSRSVAHRRNDYRRIEGDLVDRPRDCPCRPSGTSRRVADDAALVPAPRRTSCPPRSTTCRRSGPHALRQDHRVHARSLMCDRIVSATSKKYFSMPMFGAGSVSRPAVFVRARRPHEVAAVGVDVVRELDALERVERSSARCGISGSEASNGPANVSLVQFVLAPAKPSKSVPIVLLRLRSVPHELRLATSWLDSWSPEQWSVRFLRCTEVLVERGVGHRPGSTDREDEHVEAVDVLLGRRVRRVVARPGAQRSPGR